MKYRPLETGVSTPPAVRVSDTALTRTGDALLDLPCTLPQEMNQSSSASTLAETPTTVTRTAADGLAQGLAAAVAAGLTDRAAELAVQLSKLRVKCEISVLHDENELRSQQAEFGIKVHVEDRLSDRCFINLTVKSTDTIADLKRKVMILHNLPMEVQRWIIGKKIHPDQTRLHQCGVKGAGHTLYLYLVTARSVGLSKSCYEAQVQAITLMKQGPTPSVQQVSPTTVIISGSIDPARDSGVPDTLSSGTPSNTSDSLHQTNVVPLPVKPVPYLSQSSSSSSSPASVRIQEMLQSHLLTDQQQQGTPGTPAEAVLSHASPGLGADTWALNTSTTPASGATMTNANSNSNTSEQMFLPPFPSGPPVEDDEQEGWSCPACTFRNLPMWPGCEICNQQRPEEYQVPDDYVMTERERRLMEDEELLERLTHEAQEPEAGLSRQQKLMRKLKLQQAQMLQEQAAGLTNTAPDGSTSNNSPTNVFATNNSIIIGNIHSISDGEEDAELRRMARLHAGEDDLRQSVHTNPYFVNNPGQPFLRFGQDSTRADDYIAQAVQIRCNDSSEEENTYA